MSSGLEFLFRLDALATRPGDGLHPRLVEVLCARQQPFPEGVVHLPCPQVSSGPAEQPASDAELQAAGIPRIGGADTEAETPVPSQARTR
ncbi:MAG: hypothetical protein AAF439_04875 [Pseudomonadota bacterium]